MLFLADFSVIGPDPIPIYWITGFLLLTVVLMIIALADLSRRRFDDSVDRIFWLLLIVLSGPIGSILYLIRRRNIGHRA